MEHIPKNCKECNYYGEDMDGTICRHPFYSNQQDAYAGVGIASLWRDTLPNECPYYKETKEPEPPARIDVKDVPLDADVLWVTREILITNSNFIFSEQDFKLAEQNKDRYIGYQNGVACYLKHSQK